MQYAPDSDDIMLIFNVPLRLTKPEVKKLLQDVGLQSNVEIAPARVSHGTLVDRAKWLYEFELRRRSLPGIESSLGDPSWMILLDLYARDAEGRSTSVSSATLASAAPQTTGLRHISVLEMKGYIQRRPHPDDDRCNLLSLTEFGQQAVSDVLRKAN